MICEKRGVGMKKIMLLAIIVLFLCGGAACAGMTEREIIESLSPEEEMYMKAQLAALIRSQHEDPSFDPEAPEATLEFTQEEHAFVTAPVQRLDNFSQTQQVARQRHIQAYIASPVIEWSPAGFEELARREKAAAAPRGSWAALLSQNTRYNRVVHAVVNSGTVISAILITGLNSDLPGHLIAQVSENVYDSPTGKMVLIPQGSRLFGVYDSKVMFGQKRALIKWERLIYPDGSTLDLEGMPGADKSGFAGVKGEVNNHYAPMITGAVMVSLFAGLAAEYGKEETTIQLVEPKIVVGDQTDVGTISEWPNTTPPTNYLVCDGSEFDPDLCPELAVILGGNILPDYATSAPPYKIIKAVSTRLGNYSLGSYTNIVEDSGNAFAEEIAKTLSYMSAEYLKKYMEVAPTLKISPGYRFSVICSKEIVLPVYVGNVH